jgi:hypothetical protein
MSKYESLARIAVAAYESHKDNDEDFKFVTGLIAEGLHRTPPIHTGLISEECANRNKGDRKTKEHYFGRLESAKVIMDQIAKNKSFDRIIAVVKSRSRVHYTTPEENTRLKNYGHLFWREAYRRAGINLIPYVKKNKKYVYIIEDVVYNSINDVAKKYSIQPATAYNRVVSKSKNFKEWKREEISTNSETSI